MRADEPRRRSFLSQATHPSAPPPDGPPLPTAFRFLPSAVALTPPRRYTSAMNFSIPSGQHAPEPLPANFVAPPLKIGPLVVDPPILQAPMAGFTNYVYRQIVREFGGAGLQATEMISAEGFVHLVGGLKGTVERLWGVRDEPRPLAVQM